MPIIYGNNVGLVVACLTVFIIYVYVRVIQKQKKHDAFAKANGCLPPQNHLVNPWWPPFGADKLFPTLKADRAGRLPAFMLQEFEKHGHTYTQRVGAGQFVILTRSPRNVQTSTKETRAAADHEQDYVLSKERPGNLRPLVGEGVLTQDGRSWTRSRAMLRPHFSRNVDDDFVRLERHFQRLLSRLDIVNSKSEPFDIADLILKLSTDFATETVFGQSTDTLIQDLEQWSDSKDSSSSAGLFSQSLAYALHMLAKRGLLLDFYWLQDSPRFRSACRTCKSFVNTYLKEAQSDLKLESKSLPKSTSFLHSLVLKNTVSHSVMCDQLLSLLLGSRDTTASFLSWTMYVLSRNPEVVEQLRSLIAANLKPGIPPTIADINSMPYIRNVLNETLRLYPVVPINGRTAALDTVLPEGGGEDGRSPLAVPAGTLIGFNIFSMHRRKDIFGEDVNTFRPDRWSDPQTGSNDDFGGAFAPFLLGPRVCLGKNLAMLTVSYLLVRILQTYDNIEPFEIPAFRGRSLASDKWPSEDTRYGLDDNNTTFNIGITMAPRDGVWVKLHRIEH